MSTAIYTHGVTPTEVLQTLPVDTTRVSADSNGLNLGIVDGYIARAAGQVNAQLARHGIEPEALDPNTTQIAQEAIIQFSAALCLERLGASPDQIDRRRSDWRDLFDLLQRSPQVLGSAQDTAEAVVVKSNVSLESGKSRWRRGSYRW
jgi:hypothetical protein